MRRRILAVAIALTCFAIFLAAPAVPASGPADGGNSEPKAAGADLFGLTKVVKLHIEVAAEEYANGLPKPHSDDPTQWLFRANRRARPTHSKSPWPG